MTTQTPKKCIFCFWYSNGMHCCYNRKGKLYNRTDSVATRNTCDQWKDRNETLEDLAANELQERDFVPNPWIEWKNRRLMHEEP